MSILTTSRWLALLIANSFTISALAQPLTPSVATSPQATPSNSGGAASTTSASRHTIQQYGATYVLGLSSRNDNVETEEYFLDGETAETWTQMLTYQRITLPEPMAADQYVGWLKRHLEQNGGNGRLRVVQQSKEASIFGIQYAKTEKSGDQFGLALATIADARRPNEIHLIQYLLNPGRLSVEEMELQVKRWQGRFQSQAASLSR